MTIKTRTGKTLDLDHIPAEYESIYCSLCGSRMGFYHTGFTDDIVVACDDCAADGFEEDV